MFLCVVNMIFTFSGIVSNTLVIACIWKSSQLWKKLCHFMIMVLSCFDLLAVVTNQPVILLYLYFLVKWLLWSVIYLLVVYGFCFCIFGFSLSALLLMSIERYLGAYYPIFHRTSVTRRGLMTILVMLLFPCHLTSDCNRWHDHYQNIPCSNLCGRCIPSISISQLQTVQNFQGSASKNVTRKKNDDKFEKYFYLFVSCCLYCSIVNPNQSIYNFQHEHWK